MAVTASCCPATSLTLYLFCCFFSSQGCSDVAWSFDGRLIATACDDHIIRLFDQSTGRCVRRLKGHTHHVTSVCFSSSGSLLASASFDETVRVWDVQSGDQLRAIPAHSDPILSVDFAADALKPLLLSSSTDGIWWVAHACQPVLAALVVGSTAMRQHLTWGGWLASTCLH